MSLNPSDTLYALERAIVACTATGEPSNVISDLRQLHDEAKQYARAGGTGSGLNLPATNTGD